MTDNSILPQNKAELMQRIHHEWAALLDVIEPLNEDQFTALDAGGWSIKDNLAHITIWEDFLYSHCLRNLPAHEVLGIGQEDYKQGNEDEWNAIFRQRNKDRSLADVLTELHQTHQKVLADLDQLSFADMLKQFYPDDPKKRPLLIWVVYNTYDHYREHRLTIEKFLEESLR